MHPLGHWQGWDHGPSHLSGNLDICCHRRACSQMATAEAPGSAVSCRALSGTYEERPALACMPWVCAAPSFAACAAADSPLLTSLPAQEPNTLAKCWCMDVVSLTLTYGMLLLTHMTSPSCLAQLVVTAAKCRQVSLQH